MNKIRISDRTILLKSQGNEATLSFKEKVEIARLLESANVDVVEFPAIENEKTDTLLLKTVCAFLKNSVMSVQVGITPESVEATYNAIKSASKPRLSVALPISPVGMEYTCHKKAPKMIELIKALVEKAVSLCDDVEFVALDATRAENDVLVSTIKTAIEAGAKTVTICDNEASMLPDAFINFIEETKKAIPELESVNLGVLCEDTNGCAAASSMLAVTHGAVEVKCVSYNSNITSIVTISNIIRNNGDKLGVCCGIKYSEFLRIINQIAKIADGKQIISVTETTSSVPASEFNLTENDSQETVLKAVKNLGYDLSDEDSAKVFERFKSVASKKTISNKELDAIVATTALQVTPAYKLVDYVINTGNIITSSAQITLEKDGENKQSIGIGDGPIDAAFTTIEQIVGHHYELDDFQIHSVTEGREATGSALVKLRANGKLYSGNGVSTDIIGASIRAYINAINKIIFEEI
jgi:2-isopropylmalate synthase